MRPLPRLLAFTDARVAALPDLGVRAAAIAAPGPCVGLVARWPGSSADDATRLAERFVALATPPLAATLVTGRADIARAAGAQGVVARDEDLPIEDLRRIATGWIVRSVHSEDDARRARDEGADAVVLGNIWATTTHPGRAPLGLDILGRVAALGVPTYAIGGVSAERAVHARDAGAWGVAAITAAWDADDPYRAALALLAPWLEG